MNERRTARRMKSFLRGFVYFDKKRGACSCLIRDMNEEGARIIFSEAITLPGSGNTAFIAPSFTESTRLICPAPTLMVWPARA